MEQLRVGANRAQAEGPRAGALETIGTIRQRVLDVVAARYNDETARFLTERKHGEAIFGGIGPSGPPDPRAEGVSGNASKATNVWGTI